MKGPRFGHLQSDNAWFNQLSRETVARQGCQERELAQTDPELATARADGDRVSPLFPPSKADLGKAPGH